MRALLITVTLAFLSGSVNAAPPPEPAATPQPAAAPEPATPEPTAEPAATPAATSDSPLAVRVVPHEGGFKLNHNGRDLMVLGMNWGYTPAGQNYRYDLWSKPEAFIREVLDREMSLLSAMGVNAIRMFSDIPPQWVQHIYEKYGIYTAVNHLMGRYGFTIDGVYVSPVDYSDEKFRSAVLADLKRSVERYRDVPGVLMYLLGNENNYGLVWKSSEIEALPSEERERSRAVFLYTLMGEAVAVVKSVDSRRPVSLTNGDLQYLDLIKEHVVSKGLDIMGSNVYRGPSSRDLFDRVKNELGIPFVYTEFGADAFDAKRHREDDLAQARYLRAQWHEIYQQSAGKGGSGVAIGGFTFQWADGWWKYQQETNLDVHDDNASWPNAAYPDDYVAGKNNMNEEWFGICAIGPTDSAGFIEIIPRTAYYLLQAGYRLDPYAPTTTRAAIDAHWSSLRAESFSGPYQTARTASEVASLGRFRIRNLRLDLSTFVTGGSQVNDPNRDDDGRFDHQQSLYVEVEARPVDQVRARVSVNVLGHVAQNPIDEIFYEARGRPRLVTDVEGKQLVLRDLDRVKLHAAEVKWEEPDFMLEAFFRTGHTHWGYEGDSFGLYPEAYYGDQIDVYNADAPIGLAFTGKGDLAGLRAAFGPQLWWGANPAFIATYRKAFGNYTLTLIHHEDISAQTGVVTSSAVPEQVNRRTSLSAETKLGPFEVELAGLMSGSNRVGEAFYDIESTDGESYADTGKLVTRDHIEMADTLGAKLKLKANLGGVYAYLQGGYRGLVSDGGGDWTVTYTGWSLKESGRGNHWAVSGGAAIQVGDFQISPNFLFQKPLVGPMPNTEERLDVVTGTYFPAMRPRSILDAPFAVLDNRETLGAELLITWDPTPGTWLWAWDNEIVEDASLAGSLDIVYRHHPTSRDALLGFTADGMVFAFPGAPPATDLFEVSARIIANPGGGVRLMSRLWAGEGQARGNDERKIFRWGGDLRLTYNRLIIQSAVKIDSWGPYDYHRDFNYTFPLQLMGDLSYAAASPEWLGRLFTRFGIRAQFRTLDEYSNRFQADARDPGATGTEWEIMTYLQLTLGGPQ